MINDMKRLMIAALLSGASGPCKEILQLCKGGDIVSSISECGFLSIEMWPSGINLDRMATFGAVDYYMIQCIKTLRSLVAMSATRR